MLAPAGTLGFAAGGSGAAAGGGGSETEGLTVTLGVAFVLGCNRAIERPGLLGSAMYGPAGALALGRAPVRLVASGGGGAGANAAGAADAGTAADTGAATLDR